MPRCALTRALSAPMLCNWTLCRASVPQQLADRRPQGSSLCERPGQDHTKELQSCVDANTTGRGPLCLAKADPPSVQVRQILRAGHFQELVAADELTCMRKAGKAFQGWQEGPLSFPPTFKFRRGTSHYIGMPCPAGPCVFGSSFSS